MKPRDIGIMAAIGAALFLWGRCDGSNNAEERLLARIADSVATAAKAHADSVERARKVQAVADSIDTANKIAHAKLQRDLAIADSRRVQASAATAVLNARQLLALDSATNAQLRTSLTETADAVDSLNVAIESERKASTVALAKQDTLYERRIAKLQLGFRESMASRDTADMKRNAAFSLAITQARGSGLRTGRMQGAAAVAVPVLVGLVVGAVR